MNGILCDICKRRRPDMDISVVSYQLSHIKGAVRNLTYCNDNMKCYEGAVRRKEEGGL